MARTTIVKVQRPLMSNDPEEMVLVYKKGRKKMMQVPITEQLKELFGVDFKMFCLAEYQNGDLIVHKRVADKNW